MVRDRELFSVEPQSSRAAAANPTPETVDDDPV
jgi:hypothetical protein